MSGFPRYLSAEERRAMIVRSVLELAAVQDPLEITTAAIAGRMGLSQAAVFRHFSSKDQVWLAVMEWVAAEFFARVERASASESDPMAALEAMFMAHVGFAGEFPGVPRMLFGELQRVDPTPVKNAARGLMEKYGRLLTSVLERGKGAGRVDASLATPVAASMFIGCIQGLMVRALLTGDLGLMLKAAPQTFSLFRRAVERPDCGISGLNAANRTGPAAAATEREAASQHAWEEK